MNVELYKALVKELAQVLEKQFVGNPESRAAGMVINTMGWIEGIGYEVKVRSFLAYFFGIVSSFLVDFIMQMPDKELYLLRLAAASPRNRHIQCLGCTCIGSGKTLQQA